MPVLERIYIDIPGPLPKDLQGHQYVLLVVDNFSRFPEAFPLNAESGRSSRSTSQCNLPVGSANFDSER